MNLEHVHRGIGKHKKRRRIGRGTGSGRGKTSGRGHKGQKSRAGWSAHPTFQGGAMPLVRRIPKRGFNNRFARIVATVNIGQLEAAFQDGEHVTPESLRERSLAKSRYDELKILGDGQLNKKLTVSAHRFSESARQQIEAAGGQVVLLRARVTVAEKKKKRKDSEG